MKIPYEIVCIFSFYVVGMFVSWFGNALYVELQTNHWWKIAKIIGERDFGID